MMPPSPSQNAASSAAPTSPWARAPCAAGKGTRDTSSAKLPHNDTKPGQRTVRRGKHTRRGGHKNDIEDDARDRSLRPALSPRRDLELLARSHRSSLTSEGKSVALPAATRHTAPQPTQRASGCAPGTPARAGVAAVEVHIDGAVLQLKPLPGACFQLIAATGVAREARQRLREALEANFTLLTTTRSRQRDRVEGGTERIQGEGKRHAP